MSSKYNFRSKKNKDTKEKNKKNEKESNEIKRKLKKNKPPSDDDLSDMNMEEIIEYEDDDDNDDDEVFETEEDSDEDDEVLDELSDDETKNKSMSLIEKKFQKLLMNSLNNNSNSNNSSDIDDSKKSKKTCKSNKNNKQDIKCKKKNKNKEDMYDEETEELMKKIIKNQLKRNHEKEQEQEDEDEEEDEIFTKKNKKTRKDQDEEDSDDSDYNTEDDDDLKKKSSSLKNDYSIIICDDYYQQMQEENVDEILNNEDEECNSEDEKTFMKDTYEKVEIPPNLLPIDNKKEEKKKKDKTKNKKKSSIKEENKENTENADIEKQINIEAEYKELVDLKKQLMEKLQKNPKNKVLCHAVQECKTEIEQLVLKTRRNNTKEYYKLTNDEPQNNSELEYFKNKLSHKEQVKIMKDLKEINKCVINDKPYRLSLLQLNIPSKHKATVMQKINMMRSMEPGDSEYHKLKMWIDTFMRIPFNVYKDLSISMNDGLDNCNEFMKNAKKTLDECTYGLDDAKMQIMQLVGQWITNPQAMGTAIAIYGPKGTGKTSLSKDGISKIFGREFAFVSLGGSGDSSYLEGHSYTYEGSTWGKIVQILIESKCMNPIIYFDELDKVSDSPRGQEIIGILTHLTDTSQNNQFKDKYFSEVDFDLSRCLFIFSYNDENAVNPILRDRMYRIQTKGYDVKEKIIIAKKYLLPKIREQVNFKEGDIIIPDDVIQYIVSNTKLTQNEEGVRNLKRCLEIIHTKLNLFRLMHNTEDIGILGKNVKLNVEFPYTVTKNDVDIFIKNDEKQNQSVLSMYI